MGKKGIKIPRLQFNCLALDMVAYFKGVVKGESSAII